MSKKDRSRVSAQAASVLAQTETSKPETPTATVTATRPDSIRQTIRTALLAGQTTEQITKVLQEKFPNSQAAAKSAKHIAFYRSKMRKAGELPARGVVAPVAVAAE